MKSFYSSLVINFNKFPNVHQVFRPRFNRKFFERLTSNLEQAQSLVSKRCNHIETETTTEELVKLKKHSPKLTRLLEQLEVQRETPQPENEERLNELQVKIEELEDMLMPTVVKLPNRASKLVPQDEVVLEEIKSNFMANEGLTKVLSHTKLSYINNCYTKSPVGHNSYYYFGIGAKLQQGLSDYFRHEFERFNFIPVSGLCLNKSAVVEATNSRSTKHYMTDPCRILQNIQKPTTLHLTEASRETLLGFVTTIGTITSNNPLRLMCNGSSYQRGNDWFDSDTRKVSQFETVHILSFAPSIESYSMKEYHEVRDIVWNTYKKMDLPVRLVHCSLDTMSANEYDAHRIDVWLPSVHDWVTTGRISHYLDSCTVRLGMKRGHAIDATSYMGSALAAAIIENNQTRDGKFIIPLAIKDHIVGLTTSEQREYFRSSPDENNLSQLARPRMQNFEQRRYFSRKNYAFSHSKLAKRHHNFRHRDLRFFAAGLCFVIFLVDWREVWIRIVPDILKRPLYDYIYRPGRRVIWTLTYPDHIKHPKDESYDELDKSDYQKSILERSRADFFKFDLRRSADARKLHRELSEKESKE